MGVILIIIIIIILVFNCSSLSEKVEKLEIENLNLKRQINALLHELSKYKNNISNNTTSSTTLNNIETTNIIAEEEQLFNDKEQDYIEEIVKEEKIVKEKKNTNPEDFKNTVILTVGSICIVLSAIVFLLSSWDNTSNLFKTIILFLLMVMFFGFSYIAQQKFKLNKVSDTFFYLAMTYIPISLLSISIFGLFGEYLSIYGSGKYIYLLISFIITAIIYYFSGLLKNNNYLFYGSILSQLLAVIFFSLILEENILTISINILLYNLALLYLTKSKTFKIISNLIPPIIIFISLFNYNISNQYLIVLLLLTINYLCLELKTSKISYSIIFNILLLLSGTYFFNNYITTIDFKYMFILDYTIIIYIIESLIFNTTKYNNLKISFQIIIPIFLIILHLTLINTQLLIKPEFVSITLVLILLNSYKEYNNPLKTIVSYLIPIYFIISGITLLITLNITSYYYNILLGFITFIISQILITKKIKNLGQSTFNIAHIYILISYLIINTKCNIFWSLMLLILYIYNFYKTKEKKYKYLSYLTLNLNLISISNTLNINSDIQAFIPITVTFIIILIENIYSKIKDKYSNIFINIIYTISIIILYYNILEQNIFRYSISNLTSTYYLTIILTSSIYVFYNIYTKKNDSLNIIPIVLSIPAIFYNNLDNNLSITFMSTITLGISVLSLKNQKISIYTFASFIYLILFLNNINSIYLKELIFMLYSFSHYYIFNKESHKDLFKFISYLSCLFLYNSIINDLELNYTIFKMLGYITISILTIRTILSKKYIKEIDPLEYFTFSILYLIALSNYINETDGMLFVLLIITILIISYIQKYGSLFIINIIAILINIFLLTRQFWFSIPWWLYLLAIGAILLVFAIRNEARNQNKEQKNLNIIKNLKNMIEK